MRPENSILFNKLISLAITPNAHVFRWTLQVGLNGISNCTGSFHSLPPIWAGQETVFGKAYLPQLEPRYEMKSEPKLELNFEG